MKKAFEQVVEFHNAFDLPICKRPNIPSMPRRVLRARLENEELAELNQAEDKQDITGIADAAGDLIYVILGRCAEYGIPIVEVFNEIHRSNMSKLGADGKPIHR